VGNNDSGDREHQDRKKVRGDTGPFLEESKTNGGEARTFKRRAPDQKKGGPRRGQRTSLCNQMFTTTEGEQGKENNLCS